MKKYLDLLKEHFSLIVSIPPVSADLQSVLLLADLQSVPNLFNFRRIRNLFIFIFSFRLLLKFFVPFF